MKMKSKYRMIHKNRTLKISPQEMRLLAKNNCKHCHGMGIKGNKVEQGGSTKPIICRCIGELLQKHGEMFVEELLKNKKIERFEKEKMLDNIKNNRL